MKKIFKNPIITFLLGIIVSTSIGVSAYSLFANNIYFRPTDTSWKKSDGTNIENVSDAINELYLLKNSFVALFNELQLKTTTSYKLTNRYLDDKYGYIDSNGDFIFTKAGNYKIIGTAADGGMRGGGDVLLYAYLDGVLLNQGEALSKHSSYARSSAYSAMNNINSYVILNQNIQANVNSKLELSFVGEWNDTDGTMASTVIIIKQ